MAVTKTETFLSSVKFNKLNKTQYDEALKNGEISETEFYIVEEGNTGSDGFIPDGGSVTLSDNLTINCDSKSISIVDGEINYDAGTY